MKRYLITLALMAGTAVPALAQVTSTRTCNGREAVGYLGISGIDCNCTISNPGSGRAWYFRTEPKITSLEMDSPGANVLKVGDVITAINDKLITTREGADEMANIKPGQAIILTVRRNGQTLKLALTADSACPNDSRLFSIYAPSRVSGVAPPPAPEAVSGVRPATPRAWVGEMPTPPPAVYSTRPGTYAYSYAAGGVAGAPYSTHRASFGMGLSCSGTCSIQFIEKDKTAIMSFSQPPEVYSIESGGPAARAGIQRGDVITHVNGKPIDSEEGGRIFAMAKPGETVRFTIVRNNQRNTYSVKAAERTPRPMELRASTQSLERARESLTQLQRAQAVQLRRLQEDVRRTQAMEEEQLRAAQRQMLREQQEHRDRLNQLTREMAKADSEMRAAIATRPGLLAPTPAATVEATRSSRTLRYSGTLGSTEIEVRGSNPVSVTETDNEVIITTGATVVRVAKKK